MQRALIQTDLGRAITVEALERTLELLEVGGPLVEFRPVNFGALVQAGILNGSGCRNGEQLCQSQMFLAKALGNSVSNRKYPQSLMRHD